MTCSNAQMIGCSFIMLYCEYQEQRLKMTDSPYGQDIHEGREGILQYDEVEGMEWHLEAVNGPMAMCTSY